MIKDIEKRIESIMPHFHSNFTDGKVEENKDFLAEDIKFTKNGKTTVGIDAFVDAVLGSFGAFENPMLVDELILIDGNSAVVKYKVSANLIKDITFQDGTTVKATGQFITYDSVEFFDFNEEGKAMSIVQVNSTGLVNSIQSQLS